MPPKKPAAEREKRLLKEAPGEERPPPDPPPPRDPPPPPEGRRIDVIDVSKDAEALPAPASGAVSPRATGAKIPEHTATGAFYPVHMATGASNPEQTVDASAPTQRRTSGATRTNLLLDKIKKLKLHPLSILSIENAPEADDSDLPVLYMFAYLYYLAIQSRRNITIISPSFMSPQNLRDPDDPDSFAKQAVELTFGYINKLDIVILPAFCPADDRRNMPTRHWKWAMYDKRDKRIHLFTTSAYFEVFTRDDEEPRVINAIMSVLQRDTGQHEVNEGPVLHYYTAQNRHDAPESDQATFYMCSTISLYLMGDPNDLLIQPFNLQEERLRILRPLKSIAQSNTLIRYVPPNAVPPTPAPAPPAPPATPRAIRMPSGALFTDPIGQPNTIKESCILNDNDLTAVVQNPRKGLYSDELFSMLAFLQKSVNTPMIVINPTYFGAVLALYMRDNPPALLAPQTYGEMLLGDRVNLRYILMPVHLDEGHYATAIYSRTINRVSYSDSLNWTLHPDIRARILEAVRDLMPANSPPPQITDFQNVADHHNIQRDGWRCGWFCFAHFESFIYTGRTYVAQLESEQQKNDAVQRVLTMLQGLLADTCPTYILPPYLHRPPDVPQAPRGPPPPGDESDHSDHSDGSDATMTSVTSVTTMGTIRSNASSSTAAKRPRFDSSAASQSSKKKAPKSPVAPSRRSSRIAANATKEKPKSPPRQKMNSERMGNKRSKKKQTTSKQKTRAKMPPEKRASEQAKNTMAHLNAYQRRRQVIPFSKACIKRHLIPGETSCYYGCASRLANHYHDYLSCRNIGDSVCPHCKALLWPGEGYGLCCAHGKVQLTTNPGDKPYPDAPLEELFGMLDCTNDHTQALHVKKNSTTYNAQCAFGVLQSTKRDAEGVGHPAFMMNGNLKYGTFTLQQKGGERPICNQLYVIEDTQAHKFRLENLKSAGINVITAKKPPKSAMGVIPSVLRTIDTELRKHNAIARTFKSAGEQWKEVLATAEANHTTPQRLTIVIRDVKDVPAALQDTSIHPGRLNPAINTDVAGIYVHNADERLPEYGMYIYAQGRYEYHKFPAQHPYRIAFFYPLLNPWGLPFHLDKVPLRLGDPTQNNTEPLDEEDAMHYSPEELAEFENNLDHALSSDGSEASSDDEDDFNPDEDDDAREERRQARRDERKRLKEEKRNKQLTNQRTYMVKPRGKAQYVSLRQTIRYRMRIVESTQTQHWLWGMRKLSQKCIIDLFWQLRETVLCYQRMLQILLLELLDVDLAAGLLSSLA